MRGTISRARKPLQTEGMPRLLPNQQPNTASSGNRNWRTYMKTALKMLGTICAAACAIGVPQGSAAEFHIGFPVTGQQMSLHVFTTNSGTVTCKTVHTEGIMSTTGSEITLSPKFETCTAFGFINVPIDTNGCGYVLKAGGETVVECPSGKAIQITTPGCTTQIGPQTLNGNKFANNAGKTDIIITHNLSGITYDECGVGRSNGTYTGTTTLTSSGGSTVLWFE